MCRNIGFQKQPTTRFPQLRIDTTPDDIFHTIDCKEVKERRAFALSFREIRYEEVLGEISRSFCSECKWGWSLVLATE